MRESNFLDNSGLIILKVLKHREIVLDPDTLNSRSSKGVVSWTVIPKEKEPKTQFGP